MDFYKILSVLCLSAVHIKKGDVQRKISENVPKRTQLIGFTLNPNLLWRNK
jgi:hypothetical protein